MHKCVLSVLITALILLTGCAGGAQPPAGTASPATAGVTSTESGFIEHVVVEGDTCQLLAFTYNVPIQTIVELNGLTEDCTNLAAGSVLRIPRAPAGAPAPGASMLPVMRAQELVKAHILATAEGMNPAAAFPLVEVTTPEIWEALGAQVYKVTDGVRLNQGYVIRGGQVTPIGESFGGSGVHTLLVAELDGAPPAELYYAYEFGSGRQIASLGVYRAGPDGVRAYELADFHYPGSLSIALDDGSLVVSGRPAAGGLWRTLGMLDWVDGSPVLAPLK